MIWESLHTYLSPNPGRTGRSSVMSVAKCLGVDDIDAPNMSEARSQWPHWCEDEPVLAVVDGLKDLPRWMKGADPANRDAVLAALLRVAETDGGATLVLSIPARGKAAQTRRRDR
jgi:hypothetical protein